MKILAQCPGVQILLEQAVETLIVILRFLCVLIPNSLIVTNGCQWQLGFAVALFMSSGGKKKNYFPLLSGLTGTLGPQASTGTEP